MSSAFGSRQLVKCVKSLDFTFNRQSSSHAIYYPPKGKNPPQGHKPFISIQLNRKTYDPHSCNRYITQIKRFTFAKKEIEEKL